MPAFEATRALRGIPGHVPIEAERLETLEKFGGFYGALAEDEEALSLLL